MTPKRTYVDEIPLAEAHLNYIDRGSDSGSPCQGGLLRLTSNFRTTTPNVRMLSPSSRTSHLKPSGVGMSFIPQSMRKGPFHFDRSFEKRKDLAAQRKGASSTFARSIRLSTGFVRRRTTLSAISITTIIGLRTRPGRSARRGGKLSTRNSQQMILKKVRFEKNKPLTTQFNHKSSSFLAALQSNPYSHPTERW